MQMMNWNSKNFAVKFSLNHLPLRGLTHYSFVSFFFVLLMEYIIFRFDPHTLNNKTTIKPKRKANDSHSGDVGKRTKTSFVPVISQQVDKNDIRIKYSQFFSDAFNNADKTAISELLRAKCTNDVTVLYKYIGGPNPYGPQSTEVIISFPTK